MSTPPRHIPADTPALSVHHVTAGYGDNPILSDITLDITQGSFTVIVGPNACGKSTLLKTMARMITPSSGNITLLGEPIAGMKPKHVATKMALLPQSPTAPDGIIVEDLVARGRYPYHTVWKQWSHADQQAVDSALARANVETLRDRPVSELSGGQRQRVWLALVLAQDTPVVLLDEPTTYLDITHQVDVLNLARDLQREGVTVVAVLHELTLAFRYASDIVVMHNGKIAARGDVPSTITEQLIEQVYGLECALIDDPLTHRPIVVPKA